MKKGSGPSQSPPPSSYLTSRIFTTLAGLVMAVVIVKLGNPVIFDSRIEPPHNLLELIYAPWPIRWGYVLLGPLAVCALPVLRWKQFTPRWPLVVPLVWFGWQLLSASQSVRPDLSGATLLHFAACLTCFYCGVFALGRIKNVGLFWLGLVCAMAMVLWVGMSQHYGGLEQTRQAFYEMQTNTANLPPDLQNKINSPEFQAKIASDRIFSTFVYPNALAGAIILLLPGTLWALWRGTTGYNPLVQKVITGLFAYGGAACLYWSQSKAGWLIVLAMGLVVFFRLDISKKLKFALAILILIAGLGGFAVKYASYLQKGATSVVARMDYWRAALEIAHKKPFLGSGPGTFMEGYKHLKKPESEMARLAHNDYLQQASDSGWIGFIAYAALIWGSLGSIYQRIGHKQSNLGVKRPASFVEENLFPLWLGLAGFAAQSFVEFGLYIPALAWPFFLLLGWSWAKTAESSA